MSSDCQVPSIPIDRVISYGDWLRGRRRRRELGNQVASAIIRRPRSSKDRRLRKLFNGQRGLPFTETEKL